jgi:phosphosulfolactate synthase
MFPLAVPERTAKPRDRGLTHIIDKGLGCHAITDLIDTAKNYIDIVKFGWGTGPLTGGLDAKIELLQKNGLKICFGGTFFEYAYVNGLLDKYTGWLEERGIDLIELSDGSIHLSLEEKLSLVERYAKRFTVLSEVGSKDVNHVVAPYKWVREITRTLEAGAYKIITEGRESGTTGVFRGSGEIRTGLIEEILQDLSVDKFIFEAPQKSQQVWFIKQFGPNVNLGNIAASDVISLETLRLGLRSDTFSEFHPNSVDVTDAE